MRSFHYQENDGLKTAVFSANGQPAGWKANDGLLWLPTILGIVVINPIEPVFIENRFPPAIYRMLADGVECDPESNPILPAKTRLIEFYPTAIEYIAPSVVKFKYRLLGKRTGSFTGDTDDTSWPIRKFRIKLFFSICHPIRIHLN